MQYCWRVELWTGGVPVRLSRCCRGRVLQPNAVTARHNGRTGWLGYATVQQWHSVAWDDCRRSNLTSRLSRWSEWTAIHVVLFSTVVFGWVVYSLFPILTFKVHINLQGINASDSVSNSFHHQIKSTRENCQYRVSPITTGKQGVAVRHFARQRPLYARQRFCRAWTHGKICLAKRPPTKPTLPCAWPLCTAKVLSCVHLFAVR
jgi:hypothetical protein